MSEAPSQHPLCLFVYGTLKHGERNHERFCRGANTIEAATVRGILYDLPLGFPALVVPKQNVRATGTRDYPGDAKLSCVVDAPSPEDLEGWDVVRGELLRFDNPNVRLAEIDDLEGFRPGERCFYTRVLVAATPLRGGEAVLSWAYSVAEGSGTRLPGGVWPDLATRSSADGAT